MLAGRRALVTGASRGIGAAIALAFAREAADLTLIARSTESLKSTAEACAKSGSPHAEALAVDLADGKAIDAMAAEVVAAHGGVDVLVNNAAARARRGGGVLEGDPEEWDEMTAINLMAPMRLTRRLAPAMVARGGGLIINIASIASVDPLAYVSCYSATKFGLRGWSLCCHRSLREHGVKVVCVNPGVVRTGAVMSLPGFEAEHMMTPDDVAEACLLPLRTGGQCVPEEITLRNLHDAAPFMRESP